MTMTWLTMSQALSHVPKRRVALHAAALPVSKVSRPINLKFSIALVSER